mgnify:CR=1 FL=1
MGERKNVLGWRHKKGLYTGRGLETCHERALLLCRGSGTAGGMLRPRRSQTVPKGGSGPARRISYEGRTPVSIRADQRLCRNQGPGCPLFYGQLFQQQGLIRSVGVVDGTWGKIELSTVSGAIELAGDAESAEIETASGKVDIAGALGALDFESVSGDLILATERALRLDAETESGSIYLTLPAQDGFTLDYETKSGAFRSTLTEREGALITCLDDHATHYSVPALDGGAVSELTIETMSGEVTIGASSSGSN